MEGQHHPEPMLNIWTDFLGLKDVVDNFQGKENLFLNQTNSTPLQPIYADEYYQLEQSNFLKRDEEFAIKLKQANSLFEKHEFKQAQPLFEQLAQERETDWEIQIKASCCFTFSPIEQDVERGTAFIMRVIDISPSTINGYTLLLQNLTRQKKFSEAYMWIEKFLACFPSEDPNPVMDGMKAVRTILLQLKKEEEFLQHINHVKTIYPNLSDQLDKLKEELEVEKLWIKGNEWIHSPKKDLHYGQELFSNICKLNPKDYWATFLAGGCLQWYFYFKKKKSLKQTKNRNGKLENAEPFFRKALEIDQQLPHAHSLLCQNLASQGRREEALTIAYNMLKNFVFPTVNSDNDHAEKVLEALTVIRNLEGKTHPNFLQLVQHLKATYPNLVKRIESIQNKTSCTQS